MTAFISWYILITLLGWITFPLAYRLLPALADRGYTLSRAFGLMLWGFIFWLSANLGIAQNDPGGLLLGLAVVGGLSAWAFLTVDRRPQTETVHGQPSMVQWLKENIRLLLTTELLFLLAFGFMAFFRSANPDILGTEKPMELMFINGIMNSPTFPPRDLWLSGYSISYYYFGYVMTAILATFTGVPATLAFNLMLALIYGLAAVGAYGILYNLLQTVDRGQKTGENNHRSPSTILGLSFLAPIFLLLVSNAEGFLEILHARGLFWREGSNFWTWLDIPELRNAPSQAAGWLPDRFWWWWRASRVVQDYDLLGNPLEAIDEFPAFSFLLGDLHPHVLAIPFFLLAIAVALNLFLGGFRGRINLYLGELHISRTGFLLAAFMLGGMAFLNTWDILPVAALIVFSYALARVREAGWGWGRLEDVLLFGIPVLAAAYILYLPFFHRLRLAGGRHPPELHVHHARRASVGDVGHAARADLCLAGSSCAGQNPGGLADGIRRFAGRGSFARRADAGSRSCRLPAAAGDDPAHPGGTAARRRYIPRRQFCAPLRPYRKPAHPAGAFDSSLVLFVFESQAVQQRIHLPLSTFHLCAFTRCAWFAPHPRS
jgi:YYY domain-containing protein